MACPRSSPVTARSVPRGHRFGRAGSCLGALERFSTVESPEAVWPEDRSWVFFTDYDLVSTYIAGNRTLGSALAADDRLETCEVSRDTRIDDNADNPNVPPGSP